MIVCCCNALSDRKLAEAARRGASRPRDLHRACGSEPRCGKCLPMMRRMIEEAARERSIVTDGAAEAA